MPRDTPVLLTALLAVLLVLSACAAPTPLYWSKPGASVAVTERARGKCEKVAMRLDHCMQIEGYRFLAVGVQ